MKVKHYRGKHDSYIKTMEHQKEKEESFWCFFGKVKNLYKGSATQMHYQIGERGVTFRFVCVEFSVFRTLPYRSDIMSVQMNNYM